MGHITHLRKQFKSLNKYDYIITLIQRIKKKLNENLLVHSFEQTWIPFTQGCFVPRLVEIGPVVLENILKFRKVYFHYFIIISPWKRAGPFIWTNLNPLHPRMLCAKFGIQKDRQTDGWTDRRRTTVIRKAHLSFQFRWAKKEGKRRGEREKTTLAPMNSPHVPAWLKIKYFYIIISIFGIIIFIY